MRKDLSLLAPAVFSVSIALLAPGAASALTGEEAACRDAIAKTMAKYTSTVAKIVVSCNQRRSTGVRPLTDDCRDVDVADSAGSLAPARQGVRDTILSACSGAATLLTTYSECPAPAANADNGGATNGIDDFDEVVDCEIALADAHIGGTMNSAQGHPSERLLKPVEKCQRNLGKGTSRIVRTYMQERRRCQRAKDGAAGTAAYTCGSDDSRGRIAKAGTRFVSKMQKSCNLSPEVLGKLEACDDDSDGLIACARAAADSRGAELIRDAYVLDGTTTVTTTTNPDVTTTLPDVTTTLGIACGDTVVPTCNGDCPLGQTCINDSGTCACIDDGDGPCADATIFRTIHGKYGTVPGSHTSLSTGWSGAAHDVEIPDQTGDVIDVHCDEHCENCQIDMNFLAAGDAANCRCAADATKTCKAINGSDPACDGSGINTACRCFFGAPLPLSSGGTPACVVNRIRQDYAGTMNLRTGEWHDEIRLASLVHLGTDVAAPCPTCNGDDIMNDGVRHGTCSNGSVACDANGNHATFGTTSWDCFPTSATNISGTGLLIPLNSSTGTQTLSANLPCDDTDFDCPCRVCSGNGLFGCSSDAECAAAGFGTCTDGGGAGVLPNQCSDQNSCTAGGVCASGPDETYCSDPVHPDGRGFVPCAGSDSNCTAPATCSITEPRRCFPSTIVLSGEADRYDPTSGGIFCIAPTSNFAINSAAGLPGPGTLKISFTSDIRCKTDPSLVYDFPSGANCPGGTAGTTTTTLLPLGDCGEVDAPLCNGICPTGQACTANTNADACACTGVPLPACADASVDLMCVDGFCDNATDLCQAIDGECKCAPAALPQCSGATTPLCGGLCPTGEICQNIGNDCECGAPGVPPCGGALYPACGGLCDVGSTCTPTGPASTCTCTSLGLPTCGTSNADSGCLGTCSLGTLCQNVLGNCQCVSIPIPPLP